MVESFEIPAVQHIVARQMGRWASETRAAEERRAGALTPPQPRRPWITISREPGAGARGLAMILQLRRGYDVYGRELLERMAEGGPIARAAYERVERGPHGPLAEAVFLSLDRAYPGHHTYLKRLVAIASELAGRGGVILIGRGLHFVLPDQGGLRLRLVASTPYRVRNVATARGCDASAASSWIARTDREQNAFVRRLLHRDPTDVHAYDLTLDVERLGPERAADVVEAALQRSAPEVGSRAFA